MRRGVAEIGDDGLARKIRHETVVPANNFNAISAQGGHALQQHFRIRFARRRREPDDLSRQYSHKTTLRRRRASRAMEDRERTVGIFVPNTRSMRPRAYGL